MPWCRIIITTRCSQPLSMCWTMTRETCSTIHTDTSINKTSTYYALAPLIGALLSILLLGEPVTLIFIVASIMMAIGCWIAAK